MEASGTPSPAAQPPPPPPPATGTATGGPEKPGAGKRLLAVLLALALIVGVVLVAALAVVSVDSVDCGDPVAVAEALQEDGPDATCYESSVLRIVSIVFGFIAAGLGVLAILLALAYAITTRYGALLARVTGLAVATGVIAWIAALID